MDTIMDTMSMRYQSSTFSQYISYLATRVALLANMLAIYITTLCRNKCRNRKN